MKKRISFWMSLLCLTTLCAGFASCSNDDDDNAVTEPTTLEEPAYEAVSAKFTVTDEDADLVAVELTASGNYIVTTKGTSYVKEETVASAPMVKFSMFAASVPTRAGYYIPYYVYGKFQQLSETEFLLEGWGRLTIGEGADHITVTYNDGTTQDFGVEKADPAEERTKTSYLCRSWAFKKVRFIGKYVEDGRTYWNYDKTFNNFKDLTEDLNREFDGEEEFDLGRREPKEVIFTKAGTYMVKYEDESLAVATWKWENYDNSILRYSWDYGYMYSNLSNNVTVQFQGNTLVLDETRRDEEDGDVVTTSVIYYLEEAK